MNTYYKYQLRPGYGTEELLIEFIAIKNPEKCISALLAILKANNYNFIKEEDVWMNDETIFILNQKTVRL